MRSKGDCFGEERGRVVLGGKSTGKGRVKRLIEKKEALTFWASTGDKTKESKRD